MEYKELVELIKTVSDSNIVDFKYEHGDTKIEMCSGETGTILVNSKPASVATLVEQNDEADVKICESKVESGNLVISPLVGTFYVAPAEDAEPFVKVGDTVTEGQTLAIVEAMKLMNEIESEYSGIVKKVFLQNGEMVEYGQPLFEIG